MRANDLLGVLKTIYLAMYYWVFMGCHSRGATLWHWQFIFKVKLHLSCQTGLFKKNPNQINSTRQACWYISFNYVGSDKALSNSVLIYFSKECWLLACDKKANRRAIFGQSYLSKHFACENYQLTLIEALSPWTCILAFVWELKGN